MSINIQKILEQGEGLTIEFKTAASEIPKSIAETVCAFLNRYGGTILLGVSDSGEIVGINDKYVTKIKKELANALNNPQLINPPVYIIPDEIAVDGKTLLHLNVHESSQVHSTRGKIFDRNQDGDYNITSNTNLIANLFIRKQSTFTENKIYPYATISELRSDLIQRTRQMAVNRQPGHPWENLNDYQLLKSVQLHQKDYSTGKEGLTLAAILLFGKDEVLQSVLPFHKTDAICRIDDTDRYDDRDDIRTNLLESYDRLMNFTQKHLPDRFVLNEDIRVNVRNLIFREVITNTLIHREYTNPFPAKFIIGKDKIYTENANRSGGAKQLQPDTFSPIPKNPVIARVFKEIGRADELGSGLRNIFKYYPYYSSRKPELIEDDIFRCSIYIDSTYQKSDHQIGSQIGGQIGGQLIDTQKRIIELISKNTRISRKEIASNIGINESAVQKHLNKLKRLKVIERIGRTRGYWQILIHAS